MPTPNPRNQLVQALQSRIEHLQQGRSATSGNVLSSGIPALDGRLPQRGLRPGSVVEWLTPAAGSATATLALAAAQQACQRRPALVIVDPQREFYPPQAARQGLDPRDMILVQPSAEDLTWALEQSLRCRGVGAVLGWAEGLDDRTCRRLQLAAEEGQTLGLLIRPAVFRSQPSWAEVRLLVRPCGHAERRRLRLEIVYCRGANLQGTIELELDDETSAVRVAPQLDRLASPHRRSSEAI